MARDRDVPFVTVAVTFFVGAGVAFGVSVVVAVCFSVALAALVAVVFGLPLSVAFQANRTPLECTGSPSIYLLSEHHTPPFGLGLFSLSWAVFPHQYHELVASSISVPIIMAHETLHKASV